MEATSFVGAQSSRAWIVPSTIVYLELSLLDMERRAFRTSV